MQEIKVVTIEHIRHTYSFDNLTMDEIKKLIDQNKVTPDDSVSIQEDIISSIVTQND